jgi:peptidoglycan DL-endopeptidase CwlO
VRAQNLYDSANVKLHAIEHNLTINRIGLRAARANLVVAQHNLSQRLVTIYTAGDTQSTLGVILGATSVDDLVNRIESVQSLSSQDVAVVHQVVSFKHEVTTRQHTLVRDRHSQAVLVRQRAAAKARIATQIGREKQLYNSVKGEIAQLVAQQHARQLALARQVQQRMATYQPPGQNPALDLSTGLTPPAPPSQYTGVVGIAMQYLGVPYVWGGSSPSGFDCSGLVMYVYAQVGVSLPHYTGAQWQMGVPVAYSDLEPGDLVFFDGLGHVGIYIGGGEFIHAPHTGDVVRIDSLSEAWYAANYDGARRIVSG